MLLDTKKMRQTVTDCKVKLQTNTINDTSFTSLSFIIIAHVYLSIWCKWQIKHMWGLKNKGYNGMTWGLHFYTAPVNNKYLYPTQVMMPQTEHHENLVIPVVYAQLITCHMRTKKNKDYPTSKIYH